MTQISVVEPSDAFKGFVPAWRPVTQDEIIASWRHPHVRPKVSVVCMTYNHGAWIADALCGFLMQRTEFPFEILVHDDASTDETSDICRRVSEAFSEIIRLRRPHENQYSRGRSGWDWAIDAARGDLIAVCEGDDFWIDPCLLSKLTQLLDDFPTAGMAVAGTYELSIGATAVSRENGSRTGSQARVLTCKDILSGYWHTSTYVRRRSVLVSWRDFQRRFAPVRLGDTALRQWMVTNSSIVAHPDIVSVYRPTGEGIWSSLSRRDQLQWEFEVAACLGRGLRGAVGRYNRRKRAPTVSWQLFLEDLKPKAPRQHIFRRMAQALFSLCQRARANPWVAVALPIAFARLAAGRVRNIRRSLVRQDL